MTRNENDYRIGNRVYDENGDLCQIEQISSEKMGCFQQVSCIGNKTCISSKYPSNIYAIELTEKFLLNNGFEKEDEYLELVVDKYISIIYVGYLGLLIDGKIIFMCDKTYVHQLQNLYFALVGEELVLN